jgi:hypothetical protein
MSTARLVTADAMRALKSLDPGDDPSADELEAGLGAVLQLILDIHEARGPLRDVDVTAAVTPSENQRIRVANGFTVPVTLPTSVPMWGSWDPYDYGFNAGVAASQEIAPQGTSAPADGIQYRQPTDGARIEIVGTTQALWWYRADLNQWMAGYGVDLMVANGLTIDSELPFNGRYTSALGALTAERLMDVLADAPEPSEGLKRRIARGNVALLMRPGIHRAPTRGQYL